MIRDETSTNRFVCEKCGSEVRIIEHGTWLPPFFSPSRNPSGKSRDYRCSCTLKRVDPYSFYIGYCKGRGIMPNISLYEYHGFLL